MGPAVISFVEKDIATVSERWPSFATVGQCDWLVHWRGKLQPFLREYEVSIVRAYQPACRQILVRNYWLPRIQLLDPKILLAHPKSDELVPHVYWSKSDLQNPPLCTFDPASGEWLPDMMTADTLLPWTLDWLACYEGWSASGVWRGGGRHHDSINSPSAEHDHNPTVPVVSEGALNLVRKRTGTHASRPILSWHVGPRETLSWPRWGNSQRGDAPWLPFGDLSTQALPVRNAA